MPPAVGLVSAFSKHPSIDRSIDEPGTCDAIAKQPAHGAVAERDVPLVAIPVGCAVPPCARRAPWPCILLDLSAGQMLYLAAAEAHALRAVENSSLLLTLVLK